MEDDGLGLDLSVFDVHLIAAQNDGDVVTDSHQVTMPVGDVLVGDTCIDVKHDDGTLTWKETTLLVDSAM